MKKLILFGICALTTSVFAQNMRRNAFSSLFSDEKASQVGDAITVLVVESSQASNDAETSTGRSSSLGLSGKGDMGTKPLPSADLNLGTTNDFKGSGSTKSEGSVNTKISATVDSVLANGNLLIEGSRKIVINGQVQKIYIKGIVRPSDISPDNSVMSYNIADSQIIFTGDGSINSNQHPGWLTKFFHWIF